MLIMQFVFHHALYLQTVTMCHTVREYLRLVCVHIKVTLLL